MVIKDLVLFYVEHYDVFYKDNVFMNCSLYVLVFNYLSLCGANNLSSCTFQLRAIN